MTSSLESFMSELLNQLNEYSLLTGRQCIVVDPDRDICFRNSTTHNHTLVESLNPIYKQMKTKNQSNKQTDKKANTNLNNFVLYFSSLYDSTIEHALGPQHIACCSRLGT